MTSSPIVSDTPANTARRGSRAVPGWLQLLLIGYCVTLLNGCITTVEGTIREEAPEPQRVQAQIDLARGYLAENDFQQARRPLDRALALDNKSVEAHVLKAIVHQREEEVELAEKHYKLALRYDAADAQALNNYGGFLFSQGRTEAAAVPLRKAVKDTGYAARAQAFVNLGLVELALENVDDARSAFNRSLMLNSALARPHLELADIYYTDGNYVRAAEHYGQFRSSARQSPRSLCLGIRLADSLSLQDELSSYRLTLKNLYPGSREARECERERVPVAERSAQSSAETDDR